MAHKIFEMTFKMTFLRSIFPANCGKLFEFELHLHQGIIRFPRNGLKLDVQMYGEGLNNNFDAMK